MSTVTIGNQKFIKDRENGWVDAKTKQPADKGLIKLLDSLAIEEPEVKKLRVKIDRRVEPVTIAGQKFVYDVNQGWLDDKTKLRAPESLQRTLSNAVPRFGKDDSADIDLTAGFGIVAQSGLQKTKTVPAAPKTGGGTLVKNRNVSINKPLIGMINQLASIDSYLKQQLRNNQIIASGELAQAKEAAVEAKNAGVEIEVEQITPDAKPEPNKLAAVGGAAALAALIAMQFDPVKDALKQIVDFSVGVGNFVSNIAKTLNSGFNWLLGSKTKRDISELGPSGTTPPPAANMESPAASEVPPAAVAPDQIPTPPDSTPQATNTTVPNKPPVIPSASKPVASPAPRSGGGSQPSAPTAVATSSSSAPTSKPAAPSVHGLQAKGGRTSGQGTPAKPEATRIANSQKPGADAVQATGAIPKGDIVALGRYLQKQGITVSENPAFGPVGEHSPNSRHYRGMAIDLNIVDGRDVDDPVAAAKFDALKPQLEAAGYNVLWRTAGHYDHMHVSVGGPEGIGGFGGGESPIAGAVDTITNTVDIAKKLFKKGGAALVGAKRYEPRDINPEIKPRSERLGQLAKSAAIEKTTVMADSRTPQPVPTMQKPSSMPNINPDKNSPVIQSPATENDMSGVGYYLERFGFKPAESEMSR